MIVTHKKPAHPHALRIDETLRYSIDLAIAQHLRSKHGIANARRALLALGISDDEIFRRRRAESSDPILANVLRLVVTLIITRGRLSDRERLSVSRTFDETTWRAIVTIATDAYGAIVRAESLLGKSPRSDIDLEVGDY